ncbi:MAG: hypothetical protein K2X27_21620 [Candidatus Obscuribacterales bacterium]|nr:hypothetical protein [Candidatus Obscuribacterales bacterium]
MQKPSKVLKAATIMLAMLSAVCPSAPAEDSKEQVELISATRVSKADAELVEENHKTLLSNQQLIEKVLTHLGVDYYVPKVPKYRSLGANSLLALTDQIYYAAAAKKLEAPLPTEYEGQSGSSGVNNSFLHEYNNEILRSIAKKLALPLPEKTPKTSSVFSYSLNLTKQNHEILTAVAKKLGVKA